MWGTTSRVCMDIKIQYTRYVSLSPSQRHWGFPISTIPEAYIVNSVGLLYNYADIYIYIPKQIYLRAPTHTHTKWFIPPNTFTPNSMLDISWALITTLVACANLWSSLLKRRSGEGGIKVLTNTACHSLDRRFGFRLRLNFFFQDVGSV